VSVSPEVVEIMMTLSLESVLLTVLYKVCFEGQQAESVAQRHFLNLSVRVVRRTKVVVKT
jgi:hypothetical protein